MAIPVQCAGCGRMMNVPDEMAGKRGKCPHCGNVIEVPRAAPVVQPPPPPSPAGAPVYAAGPSGRTCGLAIASLVLGIVGMLCLGVLAGVPALILGIVASSRIGRSQGALGGKGLAVAGVVLGGLSVVTTLVLVGVFTGITLPAVARARGAARTMACKNNLKQIWLAISMYESNHEARLPHDPRGPLYSLALLYPDFLPDPKVFVCPESANAVFPDGCSLAGHPCSYGYDNETSRMPGPMTPILAEKPGNHAKGFNVLFFDGHVETWTDAVPADRQDKIFERDPALPSEEDVFIRME